MSTNLDIPYSNGTESLPSLYQLAIEEAKKYPKDVDFVQILAKKNTDTHTKIYKEVSESYGQYITSNVSALASSVSQSITSASKNALTLLRSAKLADILSCLSLLGACYYFGQKIQFLPKPLHLAAAKGDIKEIKMLIDRGAKVNVKFGTGLTPLHLAVINGNIDVINLLLGQKGIKVNSQNEKGLTALHLATIKDDTKVIELLLGQKGIQVDARTIQMTTLDMLTAIGAEDVVKDADVRIVGGCTPLHFAIVFASTAAVEKFMGHANVNAVDECNRTTLHWAAAEGNTEKVRILITHNADVNTRDNIGNTPLHYAVINGHKAVVSFLIDEYKVDVNVKNQTGLTALDIATANNNTDIIELLKHKAQVNDENNAGNQALDLAFLAGGSEEKLSPEPEIESCPINHDVDVTGKST